MAERMSWYPYAEELDKERVVVSAPTSGSRVRRVLSRIFEPDYARVTAPPELLPEAAAAVHPERTDEGVLTPEAYEAQRELMRAANELPLAS